MRKDACSGSYSSPSTTLSSPSPVAHGGAATKLGEEQQRQASEHEEEYEEEEEEDLHPLSTNAIAFSQFAYPCSSPTSSTNDGEGVPYLIDSIGALACRIIRVVDLSVKFVPPTGTDEEHGQNKRGFPTRIPEVAKQSGTLLFVAEVCGVDRAPGEGVLPEEARSKPLLYCDRKFVSVAQHQPL